MRGDRARIIAGTIYKVPGHCKSCSDEGNLKASHYLHLDSQRVRLIIFLTYEIPLTIVTQAYRDEVHGPLSVPFIFPDRRSKSHYF